MQGKQSVHFHFIISIIIIDVLVLLQMLRSNIIIGTCQSSVSPESVSSKISHQRRIIWIVLILLLFDLCFRRHFAKINFIQKLNGSHTAMAKIMNQYAATS